MRIRGKYELRVYNNGRLYHRAKGDNLIVQAGLDALAEVIKSNNGTTASPTHLGVGTGSSTPVLTQTALDAEVLTPRTVWTLVTRTGNLLEFNTLKQNTSGTNPLIKEAGVFNAVAAGTMFSRFKPSEFTFEDGAILSFKWSLEIGI